MSIAHQANHRKRRRIVKSAVTLATVALTACSSGESGDPEPRVPPYILQKGCEFTLQVSEQNSTSTTVEKGNTMVTLRMSMGDYAVAISDCRVVENPDALPVFKD